MAGLCAAGGQFSITAAYTYAPAKKISIYDYSQIIFASVFGFALFGEIPDSYSFAGYLLIVGSSVLIFCTTAAKMLLLEEKADMKKTIRQIPVQNQMDTEMPGWKYTNLPEYLVCLRDHQMESAVLKVNQNRHISIDTERTGNKIKQLCMERGFQSGGYKSA